MNIKPIQIYGPWREGYVLDRHVVSSVPTGYGPGGYLQFNTTRTELGELVFQLKNRNETSCIDTIVEVAAEFVAGWNPPFETIVPAPPSIGRATQPVMEIARRLGTRLGSTVCENCIAKVKSTLQMKNIEVSERPGVLEDAFQAYPEYVKRRRLLLVDDLYESGATLKRAAEALLTDGKAAEVYALAMTRTRHAR